MPASFVLMIDPAYFAFNVETGPSNTFQQPVHIHQLSNLAMKESDLLKKALEDKGITVHRFNASDSNCPDALFLNNWFATMPDGSLYLFPMMAENRRRERRMDVVEFLLDRHDYQVKDMSYFETEPVPQFLEGTGSMVMDHEKNLIYAAISSRTSIDLLKEFAARSGYGLVPFRSFGPDDKEIYHTNVMMFVGQTYVAIGLDTIHLNDRERVARSIRQSGKELIYLNNEQVYHHFAGNMLQLINQEGASVLVMSASAFCSLSNEQVDAFKEHNQELVIAPIPTIEKVGGGSVRCMLAEVFI